MCELTPGYSRLVRIVKCSLYVFSLLFIKIHFLRYLKNKTNVFAHLLNFVTLDLMMDVKNYIHKLLGSFDQEKIKSKISFLFSKMYLYGYSAHQFTRKVTKICCMLSLNIYRRKLSM